MARILYALPANWIFKNKCTILSDNFNPVFERPKLYLGGHKTQITPIKTSISVLAPTPLDKLKFAKWFMNDLCDSRRYFKVGLEIFGLRKEFLARAVGGFKENYSNMTMDFEIEIYDKYVIDDSVYDKLRPTITILGDNPTTIAFGATYTDAGATAKDNKGNNIIVTTIGSVDTSTAGAYTITYTATDSTGYTSTATRNVNVVVDDKINSFTFPTSITIGDTVTSNVDYDTQNKDIIFTLLMTDSPYTEYYSERIHIEDKKSTITFTVPSNTPTDKSLTAQVILTKRDKNWDDRVDFKYINGVTATN